jgi:hypothetical protein
MSDNLFRWRIVNGILGIPTDCQYKGGTHDCLLSESEDYPWTDSNDSSTDDDLPDFDEEKIWELQEELTSPSKPTPYHAYGETGREKTEFGA